MDLQSNSGRILYLHIGRPKTGTKWIQKLLGYNAEVLLKHHMHYPLVAYENPNNRNALTPGSGEALFSRSSDVKKILEQYDTRHDKNLILSSEFIYINLNKLLIENNGFEKFKRDIQQLQNAGFSKIIFLLLERDPIDIWVSEYNQRKKMGITEMPLEKLNVTCGVKEEDVQFVNAFNDFFSNNENSQLTVLNYDHVKNEMDKQLAKWLNIPDVNLKIPDYHQVNRSLTYEEIYIIEQIQDLQGKNIKHLTQEWMSTLPDLQTDKIYPSHEKQIEIYNLKKGYIEIINSWLPDNQKITLNLKRPFVIPKRLELEYVHIDILMKHLGQQYAQKQKENNELRIMIEKKKKKSLTRMLASLIQLR